MRKNDNSKNRGGERYIGDNGPGIGRLRTRRPLSERWKIKRWYLSDRGGRVNSERLITGRKRRFKWGGKGTGKTFANAAMRGGEAESLSEFAFRKEYLQRVLNLAH